MTLAITLDELLAWSAEERAKWLSWLKANPKALELTMQPGGRFPTVASLIDHIFLVEHRHTLRLQRRELPTQTGIAPGDIGALWKYAQIVGPAHLGAVTHPGAAAERHVYADI